MLRHFFASPAAWLALWMFIAVSAFWVGNGLSTLASDLRAPIETWLLEPQASAKIQDR